MTNISTVYNAIAIATTDNTRLITSECYRSTLILRLSHTHFRN